MQVSRGEAGELRVAAELDIEQADELRVALIEWLTRAETPVLDLSAATSCHAAIVQVLASLQKTAARAGKDIVFAGASGAVLEACGTLGVRLGHSTVSGSSPAGKRDHGAQ